MSSMYPSYSGVNRPCTRCGNPLAQNEVQCTRCGTYNPLPQQGQGSGLFRPGAMPGMSGQAWGSQGAQNQNQQQNTPVPNPGRSNAQGSTGWGATGQAGGWVPRTPSQQLESGFVPPTSGTGQGSFPANNTFGAFAQNPDQSFSQNAHPSASQYQGHSSIGSFFNATSPNRTDAAGRNTTAGQTQRNWQNQARQTYRPGALDTQIANEKKRPNALALVGIIILVLLVLGGGTYGAVYFLRHHNSSSPTAAPTPVTIVTPTGTPLFSDTFQNNNNGWNTAEPPGAAISISGGKLVLSSNDNKISEELLPGSKTYNDLRVDADIDLTQGDQANGYGIFIRGALASDGTLGTYYRFEVYGDGTYAIYKGVQSTDGTLSSDALKPKAANSAILYAGQVNHVTVIAKGTQLTLQINNVVVSTLTDTTYKGGTVAIFVSNVPAAKPGTQATFQNLALFPTA